MRFALRAAAAIILLGFAVPVSAQTEAEDLRDPDCEEDPFQRGCDDACALPTKDCFHPPCPTDLAGYSPETGGVFMSWTPNSFSDIRVYRAQGGGDPQPIAYLDFPSTRFIDHDAEPGVTYTYHVTAVGMHQYDEARPAEGESPHCGTLEAAAVPVFGSWIAAAGALLLGIIGYAWTRRR